MGEGVCVRGVVANEVNVLEMCARRIVSQSQALLPTPSPLLLPNETHPSPLLVFSFCHQYHKLELLT